MVFGGKLGRFKLIEWVIISQHQVKHTGPTYAAKILTMVDEALQLCVDVVLDGRIIWIMVRVSLVVGISQDLSDKRTENALFVW